MSKLGDVFQAVRFLATVGGSHTVAVAFTIASLIRKELDHIHDGTTVDAGTIFNAVIELIPDGIKSRWPVEKLHSIVQKLTNVVIDIYELRHYKAGDGEAVA